MNPKAANLQTLQRIDQLEASLAADRLTVDDVRNTIHQIAAIVVELSQTIPAILAELRSLAELIAKMTEPPAAEPPAPPESLAAAKKAAKK